VGFVADLNGEADRGWDCKRVIYGMSEGNGMEASLELSLQLIVEVEIEITVEDNDMQIARILSGSIHSKPYFLGNASFSTVDSAGLNDDLVV